MLGLMHEKGRGVEDSYAKALTYYKIAAEQGADSEAQFSLGRMYEGGKGVEVDSQKARAWFRKAAHQGHAGAQHELGIVHAQSAEDQIPKWRHELRQATTAQRPAGW